MPGSSNAVTFRKALRSDLEATSDKRHPDAIAVCEGLGFRSTHEGMKLMLRAP